MIQYYSSLKLYSTYLDSELIELLQHGNDDAFTELYNRYWNKLFFIAATRLKNFTDAEEVVQDIFLDLWNRRELLALTSTLASYLAVAVKYRVINVMAKRNRQARYDIYAVNHLSIADESTEEWLNFEELKMRLSKLVAQLPEKCRLVYQLSREAGYSQKQIAKELDISEKTVESHIGRAIKNLRKGLHLFSSFFSLF